jgi:predicted nucleotidyltransferase
VRDWLRQQLAPHRRLISKVYLFGSVLDLTRSPRDIDLVIVTADGAGGSEWQQVRAARDAMISPFQEEFGLPLSAMILTPPEWREIDGVIVREREALW